MSDKPKILVTVTPEMHAALTRHAARRGATVAGLIRALAAEYLESQGEPVDWQVPWGGRRRGVNPAQPDDDATE